MQLSEMKFPPTDGMKEAYPILAKYPELDEVSDQAIQYLSYFCDPQSPTPQDDINLREKESRRLSGFDGEGDTDIMQDAMLRMFILIDELRFELWFSLRMSFANLMAQIRSKPTNEDDKKTLESYAIIGKCQELAKDTIEDIHALEAFLFPDKKIARSIMERRELYSIESVV